MKKSWLSVLLLSFDIHPVNVFAIVYKTYLPEFGPADDKYFHQLCEYLTYEHNKID